MKKIYDGKKNLKLGTVKCPAKVSAQTKKRVKELESLFKKNGWAYAIELDPDAPEDITDLEVLLAPQKTKVVENKVGRNAPCPCGSGKKYKKCCARDS